MTTAARNDGRAVDQLRSISFTRDFTDNAMGSCLVAFGRTRVLCTASVDDEAPRWLRGTGKGWVTAEYSLLPGSSNERVSREAVKGKQSGRTQEIQRLIGRALRAVVDLNQLSERQITLDCDVLQADGGTRTASICGAYIALHDACTRMIGAKQLTTMPLITECGAISVGIVDGVAMLDLPYEEDSRAEVDMNVVMCGDGKLIEVQGTAEAKAFSRSELSTMLDLAESGLKEIFAAQREILAIAPAPRGAA
jgi:ribonuclease PH